MSVALFPPDLFCNRECDVNKMWWKSDLFFVERTFVDKIMIKIKIFIFERTYEEKGSMPKVWIKLKDNSG